MATDVPEREVKTVCQLCLGGCGINVQVRGDRIVKVTGMKEYPVNKGRLCPKAGYTVDWFYAQDRIKYPMKKERGEWKRISWDEALDTVTDEMKKVKKEYGARAFALFYGFQLLTQGPPTLDLLRRFTDFFGTPNVFSVDSMCSRIRHIGYTLTVGKQVFPDIENAKCVVLWAVNPENSTPPRGWRLSPERMRGRQLIVIDPRRTPPAQRAHIHVQPRPGSDAALALALINVIIERGLYDKEFVEHWTVGFDRLADHVKSYSPEAVEKITWVPADKIRQIAEVFATTKPACILQGWNGLDMKNTGVEASRSIAILHAITGNYDVPGGLVSAPRPLFSPVRELDRMEGIPLGIDRFPFFYSTHGRLFGEGQGMLMYDALLTGQPYPIKAMVVVGTNPLLTWPNAKKLEAALKTLDFLAVMTPFWNETAELAHMVLPAATFLERDELLGGHGFYNLPIINMRRKVVQYEEAWSDLKFWREVAHRLGYEEYFPWRDEEEAFNYMLRPMGLTVQQLREAPTGVPYGTMTYREYETQGLPTPSGKVELYSETLAKVGLNPLPEHREPPESPVSTPDIAKEYPVIATSGARLLEYLASSLRNVPRLRQKYPEPVVEIHPDTAARYGVIQGEMTVVESRRGAIRLKAKVTPDIIPGVVNLSYGWKEANVNLLTDETPVDPVGGNPALKAFLVRVRPAEATA